MLTSQQVNPSGPQTRPLPGPVTLPHSSTCLFSGAPCPARHTAVLLKLRACERTLRREARKRQQSLTPCKSSEVQLSTKNCREIVDHCAVIHHPSRAVMNSVLKLESSMQSPTNLEEPLGFLCTCMLQAAQQSRPRGFIKLLASIIASASAGQS